MRDIPLFTTENGVASLALHQIPYSAEAYITIQDTREPEAFLKECCDFCRAVGAEHIYASNHPNLETYPLYTAVCRMCRLREGLPETDAALFPVQQQTLEQWRDIYNEKMRSVPNARYMSLSDAQEQLVKGNGYFVHRGESLLGIGIASGDTIEAVASLIPGAGCDIVLALCNALSGEQVNLVVASENHKAVRLYQKLGFIQTEELEKWYEIF